MPQLTNNPESKFTYNPKKYSYRVDGKVVITQTGEIKLKEIKEKLEDLYEQVDFLNVFDDVDTQNELDAVSAEIRQQERLAARIKRGDPMGFPWDNEFAVKSHLYILNSESGKAPNAMHSMRSVASSMKKPCNYVEQVAKRKYPLHHYKDFKDQLARHPVWINMVEYGITDCSELLAKDTLQSQLVMLGKKRDLFYHVKEDRARIEELEDKQATLEFEQNIHKIVLARLSESDVTAEVDDETLIHAWHLMKLSNRQIADKTGISRNKVNRIVRKIKQDQITD